MKLNPLTQIDFYKSGHVFQYPAGTEYVYSNFTARADRLAPVLRKGPARFDHRLVFFGLQGFILDFLIDSFNQGFFDRPKGEVIRAYRRRMDRALGAGAVPTAHIEALHDLGYLPLSIKALPEGSKVEIWVPMFTVVNTVPEFYWLTNYIETVLSNTLWKPVTVATLAHQYRRLLEHWATETGASRDFINWQAHDFSARGMSGPEDSARSSAAHLLSFTGTDTVSAIDYLEACYGADSDLELVGGSVPATEHSVMCMGGAADERETFRRLVTEVYPTGVCSIVSDTWDFWRVITDFTVALKDAILSRRPDASGMARVVFRPDSGDPMRILTGYLDEELERDAAGQCVRHNEGNYRVAETGMPITPAERQGAVQCLWDVFGGTVTDKGYRVLNERVGLIYGDAITLARAEDILMRLARKGFASSNVMFGVGSYSYQYLSRDSFSMAMKATSGVVNGERRDLIKEPLTDLSKCSAAGLLRVERTDSGFVLHDRQTEAEEGRGELREIFRDGRLLVKQSLAQIRARLASG